MAKSKAELAAEAVLGVVEAEVDSSWLDAPGFDRSRPYGIVQDGSGVSKARYQQDGKFYDHAGELIKE